MTTDVVLFDWFDPFHFGVRNIEIGSTSVKKVPWYEKLVRMNEPLDVDFKSSIIIFTTNVSTRTSLYIWSTSKIIEYEANHSTKYHGPRLGNKLSW